VAADLRGFARAGAFGCAAIAVLTVQSTAGLRSARAVASRELMAQIREATLQQDIRCLKTGALGSSDNVRALTRWLSSHREVPVVVDPVMMPTRSTRAGARLLARDALRDMRALVSRATLVTANAGEAAALVGAEVTTVAQARAAAVALCAMGARAALVKGGHLRGRDSVDVLALGGNSPRVVLLRASRLHLPPLHGGGCVHAALIAGRLAVHSRRYRVAPVATILDVVRWARRVHRRALLRVVDVGGPMGVLVP
jgi:hydroxymethylpyrimidine/phosphomethylpyrimidine kinase